MDLLAEIRQHRRDIEMAQQIEDPAIRKMRVDGWKAHVALECLCTDYQDQMARPDVKAACDELMGMK